MVAMTSGDDGLTAVSGWTDDEIRQDHVRAAGVLYAAAALEELKLIELVEHLNELNQNKMLSIGAGEASNLLHEFWDKGYKRMPAARRAGVFTRVLGTPGAAQDAESNGDFDELFASLVTALADGPGDAVVPAAAELHANLAAHTDEATTNAAVELRATLAEIEPVLSDLELLTAYGAADMWEVVEKVVDELSGGQGPDVPRTRTLATCGATILRALPELCDDPAASDEVVAAAKQWLPANSPAA
jgi:hypothetical protein